MISTYLSYLNDIVALNDFKTNYRVFLSEEIFGE